MNNMPLSILKKIYNEDKSIKRTGYWLIIIVATMLELTANYTQFLLIESVIQQKYKFLPYLLIGPHLTLYFAAARLRCNDIGISRYYAYLALFLYIDTVVIIILGCLNSNTRKKFPTVDKIKQFLDYMKSSGSKKFYQIFKTLESHCKDDTRITRQNYWLGIFVIFIFNNLNSVTELHLDKPYNLFVISYSFQLLPLALLSGLSIVLQFIFARRRCNDIGISYYYSYLALFPFINFIPLVILGCIRTDAARKTKPSKESKLV